MSDRMRPSRPPRGGDIDLVRRRVAVSGAAAPLLLAGCVSTPWDRGEPVATIPAAPTPRLRIGDRWSYRTINRYNDSVTDELTADVVAVTPEIRIRITARDAGTMVEERYADPWTVISEATFDRPITFEPPMPLVPNPPALGSWHTRGRYRARDHNDVLHWEQRLRADRWERIDVPAGSFDCLRIVRLIDFRHPDLFRHGSERTDMLWYAPQVDRWVQREWTGSYMPGAPTLRSARAREDWVQWQLMAYRPAAG